ncbi:MAG: outer membrane protein transport protein [Myxococcales bacterium]|nr:MAG: outer membrane protein transport protein [Myxococcales bacterium]
MRNTCHWINHKPVTVSISCLLVSLIGSPAWATDGMNPIAYDARSAGMGGANTAVIDHALAITSNPAGIALSGANLDLNLTLLTPSLHVRDQVMTPQGAMQLNDKDSEGQLFPLLGIAYSMPVSKKLYAGMGIFVQGGMGAHFRGLNTMTDPDPTTVNQDNEGQPSTYDIKSQIMYIKFAPTVAYRLLDNLILGASFNVGVAKMDWRHGAMQFPEPDGDNLYGAQSLNFKSDYALGFSGRFGALLNLLDDNLRFGASYAMKASPTFDGTLKINGVPYDAQTEDFAWARELALGVAGKLFEKRLTLAADFRWVNWANAVDTVQFDATAKDPSTLPPGMTPALALPFQMRWQNSVVLAFGTEYALLKDFLFIRAGYNYGKTPATASGINPLFPPVTQHHLTAGLGFKDVESGVKMDLAGEYGFTGKVSSSSENQMAYQPALPGQTPQPNGYSVDVQMKQLSIYLGLGYDFN